MNIMARTSQQLGTAIRRYRRQKKLTQRELGERMRTRQATISKMEAGGDIQLTVLTAALAALDLELVIRPRTKMSVRALADLF